MNLELVAFLKARLEEEEANARDALTQWPAAHFTVDPGSLVIVKFQRDHDPARVLREIEVKWRIVNDYEISVRACRQVTGSELDSTGYASMRGGRDALEASCLALTWARSDHPDFQPRWKS